MAMSRRTVLVVDDDRLVRWSLSERLRADGMDVVQASSVAEALVEAAKSPDVVLLDYRLPDGDGLTALKRLHQMEPELPVLMLTAHKDTATIVEAIKAGATDYVTKPFDVGDVALRVARALDAHKAHLELKRLKADLARPFGADSMIGESAPMVRVKSLATRMAESPGSTVLITGESGTGKDLLAKVIHYASSRAARPFMNITCSALPETLLESELFGHERGAFTDARQQKRGLFELADEGTIFLDEISETTQTLQAKLLRVLEERAFRRVGGTVDLRVDVRVVAATNRSLEGQVREGRFREDLFYRLNVLRIEMPPLRDRGRDILLLAGHFVTAFSREFRRPVRPITDRAAEALLAHAWPGNVRELRNLVERAVLLGQTDQLDLEDFESLVAGPGGSPASRGSDGGIELPPGGVVLEDVERRLVLLALERTRGNQTKAAALLGLHRDQIRYRMEKFGLLK
jgi:DNA-binding NtrC family response regulator